MPERRLVSCLVWCADPARVLLLRRPASRAAGWQSVTGRVEPSDAEGPFPACLVGAPATPEIPTLARACLREIHEETGLGLPAELRDLGAESSFVGYDGVTYRQRAFAARYADAAPPLHTPEHEEGRWVDAATALATLTWESDRASLRAVFGALDSGLGAQGFP